MKNKRKPIIIISIFLAVAVIAFCCWFFWLKDVFGAANATPVYVNSIASITGLDTGTSPRYSGIVEPQKTVKVTKDDTKTVAEIYVAAGAQVKVGDPLFRYSTEEMQLSLSQAQLELEGIANQISTLKNQKATLEAEKKKASKDEQYSYTVQIQSVELQIKTEEYNSSVKKNELDKLKKSLDNADVLSTADGVIKEINTTPKTDSSGQPLPFITILSTGEYRIKGIITELNRDAISVGQAVTVHSRVDPEMQWGGKVESIDFENPISDTNGGGGGGMVAFSTDGGGGNSKSSKYYFYVVLEKLEGLILGQHVYIEPDVGATNQKTGLWLPSFYLDHDDSGSFVWVKSEKGKLEKRTIILGDYDTANDMYEIKNGVTARDYIAYPDDTLTEGMPTTEEAPAQTPPPVGGGTPSGGAIGGTVPDGGESTAQYDENGNLIVDGGTSSSAGSSTAGEGVIGGMDATADAAGGFAR